MEVKWIKLSTHMFEDEKIRIIESMPEADTILIIWIKLLAQAGKTNATGYIYLNENIPYTDEMLATIFNRPIATIRLALKTFQAFGMIEILDDHFINISNWKKHQNIEGLEKIREQTRKRVQEHRDKKKVELLGSPSSACAYCGKEATTIDHIIPRTKGGRDISSNIVDACKSCNSSKKDKDLADFLNDSYHLTHQNIDHNIVRKNSKLMAFVELDGTKYKMKRFSNVTVTQDNALDIEGDKEKNNTYSNEFEQFWNLYPRKVDKKKALKSFRTAMKNYSLETILYGTEMYAKQMQGKEKQFIKHPATFLNNESFVDGFEMIPEIPKQPEVKYVSSGAISGMWSEDE